MIISRKWLPSTGKGPGIKPPITACVFFQMAVTAFIIDALVVPMAISWVGLQVSICLATNIAAVMLPRCGRRAHRCCGFWWGSWHCWDGCICWVAELGLRFAGSVISWFSKYFIVSKSIARYEGIIDCISNGERTFSPLTHEVVGINLPDKGSLQVVMVGISSFDVN